MLIRRAFYYWQPLAAVVLPIWLFVGWGVFGPDGWPLLVLIVVCPILSAAMFVIAGIGYARASTRQMRAVSWLDVAILALWHLVIVGIGFYGDLNSTLTVLSILLGLAAFWAAVWQLVTDTSRRVRAAFTPGPNAEEAPIPKRAERPQHFIVVPEKSEDGA